MGGLGDYLELESWDISMIGNALEFMVEMEWPQLYEYPPPSFSRRLLFDFESFYVSDYLLETMKTH